MAAVNNTRDRLYDRLNQKGYGTFSSTHEVLGMITEEYYELIEAVKSNKMSDVKDELEDIAVGCLFAIACINNGSLEW